MKCLKVLLIVCFGFLLETSLAQGDLRVAHGRLKPGYMVTLNSDTLQGIIKSRKWEVSPKRMIFFQANKRMTYSPKEILSFSVDNRYFISTIAKVDVSPHQPAMRQRTPDPVFVVDTIFC